MCGPSSGWTVRCEVYCRQAICAFRIVETAAGADRRPRPRRAAPRVPRRDERRRRSRRAVPDRRELARLPRVLRAAGVDRDLRRAPDERDLRLRLDAREDPHRLRPKCRRSSSGTRACPAARRSPPTTRRSAPRGPTCSSSSGRTCEPLVEAFGYRNVSVEGYEADDVIAALAEQAKARGRPGDGRHRRPRRLPARRRRRADHDDLARHHRHEGLRPRGRDRPLRHPARAGPRLHRPQGRHVRQHPRRPRHRRQDRRASCCSDFGDLEERARARRRDLGRQAQART